MHQKTEEVLVKQTTDLDVVGISMGISAPGFYREFYHGKSNLELNVPVTSHSVFKLASIAKVITAAGIFYLINEGKLALTTALADILTDIPNAWRKVQIKHLLSHTSGIKSYTSTDLYWQETRLDVTKERILSYVADQDLEFEPGAHWNYNNTGFFLLGMVIEELTKKSYFDFIINDIIRPLGIHHIYRTDDYGLIPGRAEGYIKGSQITRPEYYSNSGLYSAGGFSATATDFLAFQDRLFNAQIIPKNILEMMLEPFVLNNGKTTGDLFPESFTMCHGIFRFEVDGKKIYAQNGDMRGFSSAFIRNHEDNIALIAVTNTENRPFIHSMLLDIYTELFHS